MKLGFFTMPVHRLDRDYTQVLQEDREAVILADRLGYSEAYVGEHVTDAAESITNSMLFLASLISDTRQIKLGTGTTNLSHTHPVLVAAQAAMLDHLLKGRFLFGVSPGALESDAEALGIRGIDRNEMFAESIGHIIDIWRGEPPYDLEGKHWKISTRETLHPEIGVGPIPKPYQKPHPPILATVVAPYSKGVIEMGKKGFLPISANFLLDKWVRTHWTNYIRGCEEAGRVANPQDWRVARSIFVHDDHKTALDYGKDNERSPYRYYFNQLFTKLKKANRHGAFKPERDFPDDKLTLDFIVDSLVIAGDPSSVVDQLLAFREVTGDFGTLLYAGKDWEDRSLGIRSMELMAEKVMPEVNAAIGRSEAAEQGSTWVLIRVVMLASAAPVHNLLHPSGNDRRAAFHRVVLAVRSNPRPAPCRQGARRQPISHRPMGADLTRMQDHSFENLLLISVTVSMISAGKGSSSSPNSARTACQSGSMDSARFASSIIFLTRFPWPAATARINGSVSPGILDCGNSSPEPSRDLSSQFSASVHFPRQARTSDSVREATGFSGARPTARRA